MNDQNQLIYELKNKLLAKNNNELAIKYNKEVLKTISLNDKFESLKKVNLDLVLQKDTEHLKAVKFENKAKTLKADVKRLEQCIKALHNKDYTCMVLKKTITDVPAQQRQQLTGRV